MLLTWLLLGLLPARPSLFVVVGTTMWAKTTRWTQITGGFKGRTRCTRHAQSVRARRRGNTDRIRVIFCAAFNAIARG